MRSIRRAAAITVVGAAALAGCAGDDAAGEADAAAPGTEAVVVIDTFIYGPDPLVVPAGTTVTFENRDSTTHTVTAGTRDAPQPEVIDAQLADGETATWAFAEAGTYEYFCTVHDGEGMTGQVVVEA